MTIGGFIFLLCVAFFALAGWNKAGQTLDDASRVRRYLNHATGRPWQR